MPGVRITPRASGTDAWGPAVEAGIDRGLDAAAEVVREDTVQSLESRADPWGAAVAPLSATTLKLYAEGVEQRGAPLAASVKARRPDARKFSIRVEGRARRYAWIRQFGNPFNRMYNNEAPAPIPPRPYMAIRPNDQVDLPPDVHAAVIAALREGIARALVGGSRRRR